MKSKINIVKSKFVCIPTEQVIEKTITVISWPMTAPIDPKLTASSAFLSKKGCCNIAAGNTISLRLG